MQRIIIKYRQQNILQTRGNHAKRFQRRIGLEGVQGSCRIPEAKAVLTSSLRGRAPSPRNVSVGGEEKAPPLLHGSLCRLNTELDWLITGKLLNKQGVESFPIRANTADHEVDIYSSAFACTLMTKGMKPQILAGPSALKSARQETRFHPPFFLVYATGPTCQSHWVLGRTPGWWLEFLHT